MRLGLGTYKDDTLICREMSDLKSEWEQVRHEGRDITVVEAEYITVANSFQAAVFRLHAWLRPARVLPSDEQ